MQDFLQDKWTYIHTYSFSKPVITTNQLSFLSFKIESIFYKLEPRESLMLDASNEIVEQ